MGGHILAVSATPGENLKFIKSKRKSESFFRNRGSGVVLILAAYFVVFLVAYGVLLTSVAESDRGGREPSASRDHRSADDFGVGIDFSDRDETFPGGKPFRNFVWSYKHPTNAFDCSLLSRIKNFTYLTSGWTKSIFIFRYGDRDFALKTVNPNGKDVKDCLETGSAAENCYKKASSKMYKEYVLSNELSHSNILKIWGWCVGGDERSESIAVVTESCRPVDTVALLHMTFRQRLEAILDVSRLLAYLAVSPLGSVAVNDFGRRQFVLCDRTLKLTDLDDLSLEEPRCRSNGDCRQEDSLKDLKLNRSRSQTGTKTRCLRKRCAGYNEKQNVINLYKHFTNLFLPINVPDSLRQDVKSLLRTYLTSDWDSRAVLKEAEILYRKLIEIKEVV